MNGRDLSHISGHIASQDGDKEPETFAQKMQRHTQKIIDDDNLDSVGFEDEHGTVLDMWLESAKLKQEGIPLSGLISKVQEVAGLMPILKKIASK